MWTKTIESWVSQRRLAPYPNLTTFRNAKCRRSKRTVYARSDRVAVHRFLRGRGGGVDCAFDSGEEGGIIGSLTGCIGYWDGILTEEILNFQGMLKLMLLALPEKPFPRFLVSVMPMQEVTDHSQSLHGVKLRFSSWSCLWEIRRFDSECFGTLSTLVLGCSSYSSGVRVYFQKSVTTHSWNWYFSKTTHHTF